MGLFGKKKGVVPEAPFGDMPQNMATPVANLVMNMKQQGMSNNQIIQELQRQGYNSQQIFDAITMSEPSNMPAGPIDNFPQQQPEMMQQQEQPVMQQQSMSRFGDDSKEKIEEMAEAIIDEKWEELVKSINKIIEWKGKVEGNINKLEQEIRDLKENFNQLHSSIVGKINEYDKNIVNVGTEVKAMSQVFEKILPTFTENVSELRRIVKGNTKKV
jgi:hypothetical protein